MYTVRRHTAPVNIGHPITKVIQVTLVKIMTVNVNSKIMCVSTFQWKIANFKSNRAMIASTERLGNVLIMYNMVLRVWRVRK